MSFKIKIMVTAMNIAFLIVSFLYPDSATPLLTLVTIISTIEWAFQSNARFKVSEKCLNWYVFIAAINSILCVVLGFTGTIDNNTQLNCYVYKFHENVAFLGGTSFNYLGLIVIVLILPMVLMVSELKIAAEYEKKCVEKANKQQTSNER